MFSYFVKMIPKAVLSPNTTVNGRLIWFWSVDIAYMTYTTLLDISSTVRLFLEKYMGISNPRRNLGSNQWTPVASTFMGTYICE